MRSRLLLLCCSLGWALSWGIPQAFAQTYFYDNFDDPNESEKKWVPLYGLWEFADGEYQQLQNAVNCMSVVADEYWDEAWNDYTFEVLANKIAGAEGWLIMFRCQGMMQPRDVVLNDHPPRMADLRPSVQYWWNIGGWNNTRTGVERWIDGARVEQGFREGHSIQSNQWYHIKIVNTPTGYELYLDDELFAQVEDNTNDGKGRIGLATWNTTSRFDEVIVYGPDGPSLPVSPKGKLAAVWAELKQ
ncbi:MAG: hypothetical protein KatS3mg115_2244 [Candidatus Poribacteria bacterium]|nr:MAG: hypothetical protein KatS3mg115_2244 [Candidatus Poribacteria bacterium]